MPSFIRKIIRLLLYIFGFLCILLSISGFFIVDDNGNKSIIASIFVITIFLFFGVMSFLIAKKIYSSSEEEYKEKLKMIKDDIKEAENLKSKLSQDIIKLENHKNNLSNNIDKNTLDFIDGLSGLEFESYVANLLRKLNYRNVEVTPATSDFGIDILCEKDNIKYAIQCKNYNNVLDSKPIQEAFSGKQYYKCHIGVVITNNYFTKHATELANENGILLWDRNTLQDMINKINRTNIAKPSEKKDPLYDEVLHYILDKEVISASLLQRKFKIGYNRAVDLINILEEKRYISSANGSKPRKVLIKEMK